MSDTPASNRPNPILLAVLGGVALLALIFFVILPLFSGDDANDTADDDPDVVVVDGSEEPTEAPSEDFELSEPGSGNGKAPAETFEVFAARDPFQQLVRGGGDGGTGGTTTPPPTGGTPTTPTTPTSPTTPTTPTTPTSPTPTPPPPPSGTGDDGTGDDGTGDDGTGTSSSGSGTGSSNDGSANVGGTTVTLVDVFTDDDGTRKATVTVNGSGYTVEEGDTFGRRFRLLDISGSCSTMLFGDSRFTLCEGEQIRK